MSFNRLGFYHQDKMRFSKYSERYDKEIETMDAKKSKMLASALIIAMAFLSIGIHANGDTSLDKVPKPRIAMLWASVRGDRSVESMAKHDLVMAGFGLKPAGDPPGEACGFTAKSIADAKIRINSIRQINPNAVIIGDLLFYEYPDSWLPEDHPWWLRVDGERKQFWPGTHRMDWNNPEYRRKVVKQTAALKEIGFDGVFYDNIRNEPEPWIALLKEVREEAGDEFLILANAGYDVGSYNFAAPYLNGMMYESGWSHKRKEWDDCIQKMQHTQTLLRDPKISIIERFEENRNRAGWPGDPRRGQKPEPDPKTRYWSLCYSLIIGDFYYLFSDNTSHKHDWYAEYDRKIGLPLGPGERINSHVWKRNYENALVVMNLPGASSSYTVHCSEYSQDSFTGQIGKSFTIPPAEGRILLTGIQPDKRESELWLGCSQVDITPPIGWRMAGNYYEKFNQGVHDPLYAKTMVWKQHGVQAALVMCDVCSVPSPVTSRIRFEVSQKLGIPYTNISVAATHTHAGPEYHGTLWEIFHEQAIEKRGEDPHAAIDYQQFLVDCCIQAIEQANSNMKPVTLESGTAAKKGIAFNRRYHMKDGTVRFNPGKMNPDIVRAAGPVDEDFPIVLFRDIDANKPLASLTSFAVHTAVFGGDQYGADFPGLMQLNLQKQFGDDFFSLYGQGTSGDTNHINVSTKSADNNSRQIADAFTQTILDAIPDLERNKASLAVLTAKVKVPFAEITEDQIKSARDAFKTQHEKKPAFLELVEAWKVLNTDRMMKREGDVHQMEIHAFRLSEDTVIVTWPHEIFVELGMALKKESPFKNNFIITLANDFDFYIPTAKAFEEGSYEIVTSSVNSGAGEKLVEKTLDLLGELKKLP